MKISRAYKVELDPNNAQRTALLCHAGAARWAYNWGLRRKIDEYQKTGKSPSAIDLHRELNILKKADKVSGGVPWMYEVSKCAAQEALRDLDKAFSNFFRRCKEKKAGPRGFPRFKSRHRGIGGFHLTGALSASMDYAQLPRIGSVLLKESGYLPTPDRAEVRILSATVSERAGRWFVSFAVEEDRPDPKAPAGNILGIDMGIAHLATLSDGTVFENPRALKASEQRLRRLQKSLSRKKKGSSNRRKAKHRLARRHYRVSNIRKDSIQKATSVVIAKRPKLIGIETLNVRGMMKNHHLARALSDASMSEFLRVLQYKAGWAGIPIVKADRWFPSSKLCSNCGVVNEDLRLSDRVFGCSICGSKLDRDLNAALNLRNLAASTASSAGFEACGVGSSGRGRKAAVKLPTMKQESNSNQGLSLIGSV